MYRVKVTATDSGILSAFDIFGPTVAKLPGQILMGDNGNDMLRGGADDSIKPKSASTASGSQAARSSVWKLRGLCASARSS